MRALGGFFENVNAARRAETDDVRQSHIGTLDLTRSRLISQVLTDLPDVGDAGGRNRVTLGLKTTRDVDRKLPISLRCAGVEEVHGTTHLTELQIVVVN